MGALLFPIAASRQSLPSKLKITINVDVMLLVVQVTYDVRSFLEKNRDTLSWNLLGLMKDSDSQFVSDLFNASITDTGSLHIKYVKCGFVAMYSQIIQYALIITRRSGSLISSRVIRVAHLIKIMCCNICELTLHLTLI